MSLIALKQYMQNVKITSLKALSLHFNQDPDFLRQMLGVWMKKGCVKQCQKTSRCGISCGKCDLLTTEIYEWTGMPKVS